MHAGEIDVAAADVEAAAARLQPQDPEGQLQPDDFFVVRIERHDVQRLRPLRPVRPIDVRAEKAALVVELDQRLLRREALTDGLEVFGRGGDGGRADVDMRFHEVQAGGRQTDHAEDADDGDPDDDPDPGFDFAGHVSLSYLILFASSTQIGSLLRPHTAAASAASRLAPGRSPC